MAGTDLKTEAFVLRRTNIGEADRLLDFLTPGGKVTVLARSVRREKSRLAGGIEMFCLSEITIHQNPKTEKNILTSAKMLKFYQRILSDLDRLELASEIIRKISRAAEQVETKEYFNLVKECHEGLNNPHISTNLVTAWFYFNFASINGEQINLSTDTSGMKLDPNTNYAWDSTDKALRPLPQGKIHADEIKLMRLILASPLSLVGRINNVNEMIPEVLYIAKSLNQL